MGNPYDYLAVISQMERAHSQFLEVVKRELDALGIRDINNVQALMLSNIGSAKVSMGELTQRGCYHGSNASYNVKKMVENGYLTHERSLHDRRSCHVGLTERGVKIRDQLMAMHQRHIELVSDTALTDEGLAAAAAALDHLERIWLRAGDLSAGINKIASLVPAFLVSPTVQADAA
jgi:DNA-binding MarR family transcriptional regulator